MLENVLKVCLSCWLCCVSDMEKMDGQFTSCTSFTGLSVGSLVFQVHQWVKVFLRPTNPRHIFELIWDKARTCCFRGRRVLAVFLLFLTLYHVFFLIWDMPLTFFGIPFSVWNLISGSVHLSALLRFYFGFFTDSSVDAVATFWLIFITSRFKMRSKEY